MINEETQRPKPEMFLKRIKAEEKTKSKGKLTIYFGAAPGVGKTYSMLQDAKSIKAEGKDVVIGYVEPHKRPETEALFKIHEIIPPITVEYRGVKLYEMDIDSVLKRKPQIVLMDELAHSNAPGSRHTKRYQDAEELLNAGIDVWTTLNVQHLESLNDAIYKITKIHVRETLPDTLFHSADEVRLIDLSPERLITRLKEGKIYLKDLADKAIENFFRKENLLALREISLRLVLNRVDGDMRQHMDVHPIGGPWPAKERILVGISPTSDAEQLIRSAFQLASTTDGELIVFFLETIDNSSLREQEKQWLINAMDTARKFNAKIVWMKGEDIADEISNYSQSHNITKIVIGKPHKKLGSSLAQNIIWKTKGIDIFLFGGHEKKDHLKKKKYLILNPLKYLISAFAIVFVTLIGFLLQKQLDQTNLLLLLFLPVILSALFLGVGPSIFAGIISMISFDYFFVSPIFTFVILENKYFLTFVFYLAIVLIISNLASKTRKRVEQLQQSEAKSAMLYELSQDLVTAWDKDSVITILMDHIKQFFPCEIAAFFPEKSRLLVKKASPGFHITQKELGVANWVYTNDKPGGQFTETLPQAWAFYLPIKTNEKVLGVMGFRFHNSQTLTSETQNMLETIMHIGALALESIENLHKKS